MTKATATPAMGHGVETLIVCTNLVRTYRVEHAEVGALKGVSLQVESGEMVAIVGPSGSGKSTLLNILAGLDAPTSGVARVAGWDLLPMSDADRLSYRRTVVGFVREPIGRNLLPNLRALENIMLPMAFAGASPQTKRRRAKELLDAMGIGHLSRRLPGQLSGGEQQRVAIAVALANHPLVLIADEPTGELDSATGDDVLETLQTANRVLGATVVIATHDSSISEKVNRTITIRNGRISSRVVQGTAVPPETLDAVLAEEYAVVDRTGRVQLPKEFRKALGLRNRVRLELESDHIGIWAGGTPHRSTPAPAESAHKTRSPIDTPPPSPAIPVPTDKPHLHFQTAPERPTPNEQATSGHPLAALLDKTADVEEGLPYTPRVLPSSTTRPMKKADHQNGEGQ